MGTATKKEWNTPEICDFSVAEITEGGGGTSPEGFFNTGEDPAGS
ncbi:MAG: hypothetical protein AAFQ90_07750 [Pseudomonadota bacterium]